MHHVVEVSREPTCYHVQVHSYNQQGPLKLSTQPGQEQSKIPVHVFPWILINRFQVVKASGNMHLTFQNTHESDFVRSNYIVPYYIYTYIHTYIHTYICIYIYIYIHAYIHTYKNTYIHTIHTYIHTYKT